MRSMCQIRSLLAVVAQPHSGCRHLATCVGVALVRWTETMDAAPTRAPEEHRPETANAGVAVVSLTYVGLPTAISFAEPGCRVIGYNTSEEVLAVTKTGSGDSAEC
jgi:hypothetical protein